MAVPNIRAPLDVLRATTSGQSPNVRAALGELRIVTGGNPAVRAAFASPRPVTGGNPNVRSPLVVLRVVIPVFPEPDVATLVFPTLIGLGWNVKKGPQFNNKESMAADGHDTETAYMEFPIWNFEMTFDFLPDGSIWSANPDMRTLAGFFLQNQGKFGRWLFHDPDDYHVVGGAIATADGVTLQWPFQRSFGGFFEPIGQVDLSQLATFASTDVNTGTNQVHIANHGFVTGQNPPAFVSSSGGLPAPLAANTPYWIIAVDANHIQFASTHANALANTPIVLTTAGTGTDAITKGYAIYDNGSIVNPGSAVLALPNQVVFGSAPLSGHVITADFDFYFVCRFLEDRIDFEKFMFQLWEMQKLDFRSIIQ